MQKQHIVSSFNDDLERMESALLEMGGLVERQLLLATQAMQREDRELAKKVLYGDERINELEAVLNDTGIRILALRQPVAIDLRNVVMTLKIAGHLERIGDYTKNMARRLRTITKADAFIGSEDTLVRMSEQVQSMIKMALDAYSQKDAETSGAVRMDDEKVDQMHNTLFRELLTYMIEDTGNIAGAMHLLFVGKNIERMGDHVADICKETIYLVTGEWPKSKRPKEDKTSKMIIETESTNKPCNP